MAEEEEEEEWSLVEVVAEASSLSSAQEELPSGTRCSLADSRWHLGRADSPLWSELAEEEEGEKSQVASIPMVAEVAQW